MRLDRALICPQWRNLFPLARLVNMEVSISDHSPLWLDLGLNRARRFPRRFKFENAWVREPMCRQIILDLWLKHHAGPFSLKLQCCSTALAEWGRNITGRFTERILKCNNMLKQIKGRRDEASILKYKEVHEELFEALTQKEIYWR